MLSTRTMIAGYLNLFHNLRLGIALLFHNFRFASTTCPRITRARGHADAPTTSSPRSRERARPRPPGLPFSLGRPRAWKRSRSSRAGKARAPAFLLRPSASARSSCARRAWPTGPAVRAVFFLHSIISNFLQHFANFWRAR